MDLKIGCMFSGSGYLGTVTPALYSKYDLLHSPCYSALTVLYMNFAL